MTLIETQGFASMSDGAQLRWMALGDTTWRPPVVMLRGGPGLPDYLGDVAPMIADLAPVYRYDQRGTGQSPWRGRHSLARHVDDLAQLLDAWAAPKAVLIGHSYGTDLTSRFCLAHSERIAGMLLMCGPFVGDWRTADRVERDRRMSAAQQERLVGPHGRRAGTVGGTASPGLVQPHDERCPRTPRHLSRVSGCEAVLGGEQQGLAIVGWQGRQRAVRVDAVEGSFFRGLLHRLTPRGRQELLGMVSLLDPAQMVGELVPSDGVQPGHRLVLRAELTQIPRGLDEDVRTHVLDLIFRREPAAQVTQDLRAVRPVQLRASLLSVHASPFKGCGSLTLYDT
ncbi:alpha/beta hydrolase [Streptomyces sp. AN091965]|nr:alpha/beta hydrolase [Streptomyces sp. AN091965]MCI3928090.1 alpha/beta hydrolase [Streptomyces sp. AN091965]